MQLKLIPAFGYETANCNAINQHRKVLEKRENKHNEYIDNWNKQKDDEIKEMRKNSYVIHWEENKKFIESFKIKPVKLDLDKCSSSCIKYWNIYKIAAMIPGIGLIIGAFRILDASLDSELYPNKSNHIIRGIIEICGLGILILPIDIAITIYREIKVKSLEADLSLCQQL